MHIIGCKMLFFEQNSWSNFKCCQRSGAFKSVPLDPQKLNSVNLLHQSKIDHYIYQWISRTTLCSRVSLELT